MRVAILAGLIGLLSQAPAASELPSAADAAPGRLDACMDAHGEAVKGAVADLLATQEKLRKELHAHRAARMAGSEELKVLEGRIKEEYPRFKRNRQDSEAKARMRGLFEEKKRLEGELAQDQKLRGLADQLKALESKTDAAILKALKGGCSEYREAIKRRIDKSAKPVPVAVQQGEAQKRQAGEKSK